MPKTHTIILKPWEAAAFADGSKTSLLRLVEPQPTHNMLDGWCYSLVKNSGCCLGYSETASFARDMAKLAPYQPGDTLACKETWRLSTVDDCACYEPCSCKTGTPLYRADDFDCDICTWLSPVTMPRWAVRTVRKVVGVQCLRVQELNTWRKQHLGIDYRGTAEKRHGELTLEDLYLFEDIEDEFQGYINELSPCAWERNDWAWLYDLEVV